MFVATNRFRVRPCQADAFEQAWLSRESHLHAVDGFQAFHLLKGPAAGDQILYTSLSLWASEAAFRAWTRSEPFRRAHAGIGATRAMTFGPPQFEGFETLRSISPRPAEESATEPAARDLRHDPAQCFPTLASLDLPETIAFYRDRLGFAPLRQDDDYAILRRDEMELHAWLTRDPAHPRHTSCYIRGGQVAALHREFEARGVPLLSPFELRPWGMREFHLLDPHGNLLRFGCAP